MEAFDQRSLAFHRHTKKQILVNRHLENPKAEGLAVIKELKKDTDDILIWSGKMYDASKNSYFDVRLAFKGCDKLLVSNKGANILSLIRN